MAELLHIDGNEWLSRAEMAAKLDVSERTITRKVNRGELVRKNNPNGRGKLYRRAAEADDTRHETRRETGQDNAPESDTELEGTRDTRHERHDTRQDTTRDTAVSQLISRLEDRDERISELEREVGRLKAENNQLRADLEDRRTGDVQPDPEADIDDNSTSRAADLVDALRETADTD
jgi:hypothetical protein